MKYPILIVCAALALLVNSTHAQIAFPSAQPENGNFNRPLPNEELDISPPGFCWWRAAPRGEINYQLRIEDESNQLVYQSGVLRDPVHVPDKVLSEGKYNWIIDAIDQRGQVVATRPAQGFTIRIMNFAFKAKLCDV